MNALGVLAPLAADHPLREGMVGVARDTRETAILDGDDEAAGGRAVVRTDGQHAAFKGIMATAIDRKSTRLNSSHGYISYAVFCLKKKKRRRVFISLRLLTCSSSNNH